MIVENDTFHFDSGAVIKYDKRYLLSESEPEGEVVGAPNIPKKNVLRKFVTEPATAKPYRPPAIINAQTVLECYFELLVSGTSHYVRLCIK
ncbi:hypothetical protein J6590_084480 [Homalodisca vitripennis]|nr:hypothetical protein J6590_084480 [Homalodisca vitripennis]